MKKKITLLVALLLCSIQDVSAENTSHVDTYAKCKKYVVTKSHCKKNDPRCIKSMCGKSDNDFHKNHYFGEKQLREYEKKHGLKCHDVGGGQYRCE